MVRYVGLPVVSQRRLKVMLEVPLIHPFISNVEFYLEVKELECGNPSNSSKKRKRAQIYCVSKPWSFSSLWFDDHEFREGLCFKDRDELKKAVDWCSIRGQWRYRAVQETEKDRFMFECIKWKCKWSLSAARMEKNGGCFEITKYTGPHTCLLEEPATTIGSEFGKHEIERAVRAHPTVSAAELKKWWKEKTGYGVEVSEMKEMKWEVIRKFFEDWDQSFRVMPKLVAALHSSNGLLAEWQYDHFPNPGFASFRGVFWAFPQSIEGFPHCRPLIAVYTIHLSGKYDMTLMIASGIDAANEFFPLAFAVTKEVSSNTWRWFLTQIREKVTQRKGLCLISNPHPDILAVINEPGSLWQEPWAYHRYCLVSFCSQFGSVFKNENLKICVLILTCYSLSSLIK